MYDPVSAEASGIIVSIIQNRRHDNSRQIGLRFPVRGTSFYSDHRSASVKGMDLDTGDVGPTEWGRYDYTESHRGLRVCVAKQR